MAYKSKYACQALRIRRLSDADRSIVFEFGPPGSRAYEVLTQVPETRLGLGSLGRHGDPRPDPAVFQEVIQRLRKVEMEHDQPLWLLLRKPCEDLGLINWEAGFAELVQAGVPMYRIPHILADPATPGSPSRIVLCGSSPLAKAAWNGELPGVLARATAIYCRTLSGPLDFHIFTDASAYDQTVEATAGNSNVTVHNPAGSAVFRAAPQDPDGQWGGGGLENPWLRWMARELRSMPVDAVHFFCHGYRRRTRGSLAFAQSPLVNDDQKWSRFIDSAQLAHFLDVVGAWSMILGSVPGDFSSSGARRLLSGLAELRAGPIYQHTLTPEYGIGDDVAAVISSLFRGGTVPPGASFLSLSPARLVGAATPYSETLAETHSNWPLLQRVGSTQMKSWDDSAESPAWVQSAQRFFDNHASPLEQYEESGAMERARQRGRVEAVEKLETLMKQLVGTPGSEVVR